MSVLSLIEKFLTAIPGKTYLGALGLLAGVVYNVVVTKDYQAALVLAGNILAVLGIRTAFDKQTKEVELITQAHADKVVQVTKDVTKAQTADLKNAIAQGEIGDAR